MTQDMIPPVAVPVPEHQRIVAIDVLRGAAVLGILVMNIQSFSMIGAASTEDTLGRCSAIATHVSPASADA